jgi:MFS family permease
MVVMMGSAITGAVLGFSASLPYIFVALLAIFYGISATADSASLTAGAVAAAPEGFRGATLAVHSTLGFGAAFLGPLAVGVVLDAFGGGRLAWGMGFLTMAAGCLLGPVFLYCLGVKSMPGSKR